jgi:hypothetical protein
MSDFFFGLVPSRTWPDILIGLHIEKCPRCQSRLASREEARSLLVQPGDLSGVEKLWPVICGELGKEVKADLPARTRPGWKWAWAWGAAAVLAATITGLWLLRGSRAPDLSLVNLPGSDRFELEYVRIAGETASAYVYQPQNSDMVLVWAGKSSQGGER